jgi:transcriptional regulator with XRE-family HTH domain
MQENVTILINKFAAMSYGQKIREIRRRELMSQEAFADKVGVSRSVISQIEIDRIRPSLETLRNISREFDVSLEFLMLYEDEPEKDDNAAATSESPNPAEDTASILSLKVMPDLIRRVSQEPKEEQPFNISQNYSRMLDAAKKNMPEHHFYMNERKEEYASHRLQQVPMVGLHQYGDYQSMGLRGRWMNDLPKLTLPVSHHQQLVAFEMPGANTGNVLLRDIAVCSLYPVNAIDIGREVLIWMNRSQPIFAILEQKEEQSFTANGIRYRNREISEIWQIEFLLSNSTTGSLRQQLTRVEAKLDALLKKGD